MPISTKVGDIASRSISSVGGDSFVYDAVTLMVTASIGAIVVASSGKPVGMITERDLMKKNGPPGVGPQGGAGQGNHEFAACDDTD